MLFCLDEGEWLLFLNQNNYHLKLHFDFDQTNSPEGSQNVTVLELIKSLRDDLSIFPGLEKETSEKNKMYNLRTKTNKQSYSKFGCFQKQEM